MPPADDRARTASSDDVTPDADDVADPAHGGAAAKPVHRPLAPLQYRDRERYEVLAEHGRGGLGKVLRARDRELGRAVAIKELLKRSDLSELRFFREAMITARLEHPGIVPVHEAGRWSDGTPFYAMKLVAGRPLRDLIESATSRSARIALLPHLIAVADAIAYAHANGIVHRDLKPSNVVVGDYGETVVIDWGLAKEVGTPRDEVSPSADASLPYDLTRAGSVLGTPAYMAPEQRLGDASPHVDIFALGAILHDILHGKPFGAPDATGEPSAPSSAGRRLAGQPRDLFAIMTKATRPVASERYGSAAELADDLRAFLRHEPVRARRYSVPARAALFANRHRNATWIGVTALLVITALLAAGFRSLAARHRRALAAESTARTSERASASNSAKLTLANARLLLHTDPTEAVRVLASYEGPNRLLAGMLRSDAIALGASELVVHPHSDTVKYLRFTDDGALLSQGEDGRAFVTVGEVSHEKVVQAAPHTTPAYAAEADMLAILHPPSSVYVLDLQAGTSDLIDVGIPGATHVGISPDGSHVAITFREAGIGLYARNGLQLTLARTLPIAQAIAVRPRNDGTGVALGLNDAWTWSASGHLRSLRVGAISAWTFADTAGLLVAGTREGTLHAIDAHSLTTTAAFPICKTAVTSVAADRGTATYACREAVAGVVDLATQKLIFQAPLSATGLSTALSKAFAAIGCEDGTILLIARTSGSTWRYRGHETPVNALAFAGQAPLRLASGDSSGVIRVWPAPIDRRSVANSVDDRVYSLAFVDADRRLVGVSSNGFTREWNGEQYKVIAKQKRLTYRLKVSRDGEMMAVGSLDGTVVAVRIADGASQLLDVNSQAIADMEFVTADELLMVAGQDGLLTVWSPFGSSEPRRIVQDQQPLGAIETLRGSHIAVIARKDGSLALIDGAYAVRDLPHTRGIATTMLRTAPDKDLILTGSSDGKIHFVAPSTGRTVELARMPAAVRNIAIDPNGRRAAALDESGNVLIVRLLPLPVPLGYIERASTNHLVFSRDGGRLAMSGYGGVVRFLEIDKMTWTTHYPHNHNVTTGAFSSDGGLFATASSDGAVVITDLSDRSALGPYRLDMRSN